MYLLSFYYKDLIIEVQKLYSLMKRDSEASNIRGKGTKAAMLAMLKRAVEKQQGIYNATIEKVMEKMNSVATTVTKMLQVYKKKPSLPPHNNFT